MASPDVDQSAKETPTTTRRRGARRTLERRAARGKSFAPPRPASPSRSSAIGARNSFPRQLKGKVLYATRRASGAGCGKVCPRSTWRPCPRRRRRSKLTSRHPDVFAGKVRRRKPRDRAVTVTDRDRRDARRGARARSARGAPSTRRRPSSRPSAPRGTACPSAALHGEGGRLHDQMRRRVLAEASAAAAASASRPAAFGDWLPVGSAALRRPRAPADARRTLPARGARRHRRQRRRWTRARALHGAARHGGHRGRGEARLGLGRGLGLGRHPDATLVEDEGGEGLRRRVPEVLRLALDRTTRTATVSRPSSPSSNGRSVCLLWPATDRATVRRRAPQPGVHSQRRGPRGKNAKRAREFEIALRSTREFRAVSRRPPPSSYPRVRGFARAHRAHVRPRSRRRLGACPPAGGHRRRRRAPRAPSPRGALCARHAVNS